MRILSLLLIFSIASTSMLAQEERKILESKRNKIIQEIEVTSEMLASTAKEKEATLSTYQLLDTKIKKRKSLIESIQRSISTENGRISKNKSRIDSLNQSVEDLKQQYIALLKAVYIKERTGLSWSHYLSFSSINEAFRNWRYRKQFKAYVASKKTELEEASESILMENKALSQNIAKRSTLLADERKENKKLSNDQADQTKVLAQLKQEEARLKEKLRKGKKEREKLNEAIEKAIINALKKKKAVAKATDAGKSIQSMKGKLPWPSNGVLTGLFGTHPHPSLRNVKVQNNGVDISDAKPLDIRVVADGQVVAVSNIAGYDQMIIVQHDTYYSVYSRLNQTFVENGEKIRAGDTIGKVTKVSEGKFTLHFELWKDKEKLDPSLWLNPN